MIPVIPKDDTVQSYGHSAFWSSVVEMTIGSNREFQRFQVSNTTEHVTIMVEYDHLTLEGEDWLDTFCSQCSSVWDVRDGNVERHWSFRLSLTPAEVDYNLKPPLVPEWIWEFCSRMFMKRQGGELLWVACGAIYWAAPKSPRKEEAVRVISNNGSEVFSTGWTTEELHEYVGKRIPLPTTRYSYRPKLVDEHDEFDLDHIDEEFPAFHMWVLPVSDIKHLYSNRRAIL